LTFVIGYLKHESFVKLRTYYTGRVAACGHATEQFNNEVI